MQVVNTATQGNFSIDIVGTATPVDSAYGAGGAFVVSFPGTPAAECPGPNYIVQGNDLNRICICCGTNFSKDYAIDWAIVQTQEWNTLYILSRERQPSADSIDVSEGSFGSGAFLMSLQAWIDRAVAFGSNATGISKFDQTGCESD